MSDSCYVETIYGFEFKLFEIDTRDDFNAFLHKREHLRNSIIRDIRNCNSLEEATSQLHEINQTHRYLMNIQVPGKFLSPRFIF